MSDHPNWPEPLLQPQPHTGCMEHSVAYIAHCLGHPEVTPDDVLAYRAESKKIEAMYPEVILGATRQHWWQDYDRDGKHELHKRYWLGPSQEVRAWMDDHLAAHHIALVHIFRVSHMSHCVVLLESDDDEVLIMDPLYGFKIEPWSWFQGQGPGNHGAHHIDSWYHLPDGCP